MKKVLCLVLKTVIIVVFVCVSVGAKSTSNIRDDLREVLATVTDDEQIAVYIRVYDDADKFSVDEEVRRENSFPEVPKTVDDVTQYKQAYEAKVKQLEDEAVREAMESLGIAENDVVLKGEYTCFAARMTKSQILSAEENPMIAAMDVNEAEVWAASDYDELYDHPLFWNRIKKSYFPMYGYREPYIHADENCAIDWVLIKGTVLGVLPVPFYEVIGNRVVNDMYTKSPFSSGCGLYDVEKDEIIGINSSTLALYDGLEEAYELYGEGRLLGDLDGDNELSILDVTAIQRCLAGLQDYPVDDMIVPFEAEDEVLESFPESAAEYREALKNPLKYYSDFDRDSERSILDATAIQRYLAGLPANENIGK